MSKDVIYVQRPGEVPNDAHFAIITGSSKDDGYGGQTNHVDYVAYLKREDWEAAIRENTNGYYRKDFKAIEVRPAHIVISVDVK